MDEFALVNGLKVVVVPKMDVESVTVALTGLAGSAYEESSAGAAHFLEHLLFDGSKNYPTIQSLNRIVDDLGSRKNGGTNKDTVCYHVKSLSDQGEKSFECLSEMLLRPLLKQEDIDREKTIIEQEINRFKDDPAMYVQRKVHSLTYPGHPLGRFVTGDIDEVRSLQRDDLVEFWRNQYTASNFVIVIAGNISVDQARRLSEKYFGEMPTGRRNPILNVPPATDRKLLIENRDKLQQAHFLINFPGYDITDDRSYPSTVLMRLLARGFNSRLYLRLRVEKAMIYSLFGWSVSKSFGGWSGFATAVDEDLVNEALAIISEEIDRICNEKVEDDELARAINFASTDALFNLEANENLAPAYGFDVLCRDHIVDPKEAKERYLAVTKDNILKVARETLAKPPKILVLARDLNENQITSM